MIAAPIRYRIRGLPAATYLCFRIVEQPDGRELWSLIPDAEEQHVLDVVSIHSDDPALSVWDEEDA